MPGRAGTLIAGRYALAEPVGEGGRGRVWRARDQLLGGDVAVKEIPLPPQSPQDRAMAVARVLRESEIAALALRGARVDGLGHPGVVIVHDAAEQDGALWVVMRFVPGTSLRAEIGRLGRLPWRRAARIGEQAAEALAAVHGAMLVHGDLKPGDILLTGPSADRVIVTLGTGRMDDLGTLLNDPRGPAVVAYLAPERLVGNFGSATDMWALGAALYTAVQGRPPFTGPTTATVLKAILYDPVTRPEHAGPLRDLIGALLAKDPADRPDAQAAMTALAGLAAS